MIYLFEYSFTTRDPKKSKGVMCGPSTDYAAVRSSFLMMQQILHAVELKFVRKLRPIHLWLKP